MQYRFQMHFASSNKHMLSWLLNFSFEKEITFIGPADGFNHFGKFTWHKWLYGHFDDRLGPEFERNHNIDIPIILLSRDDGGGFCDRLVHSLQQNKTPSLSLFHLDPVAPLEQINFAHTLHEHILLIIRLVALSKHSHFLSLLDCSRYDSAQDIKTFVILLVVHFDSVNKQGSFGITLWNLLFEVGVRTPIKFAD